MSVFPYIPALKNVKFPYLRVIRIRNICFEVCCVQYKLIKWDTYLPLFQANTT